MQPPLDLWQNFSSAKKIIFIIVSLFLVGLIILALSIFVPRLKGQGGLPQAGAVPIQDCLPSTLVIGTTTFQIQNLSRAADGSLTVPQDTSGIAYRVEGTDTNSVFVLSPTPQNLAVVSTVNIGSEATATWSNCSSTTYRVSGHEPGSFNGSKLPAQSQKGITMFFPIDSSGSGFVFTGEVSGEHPAPSVANTVPTTSNISTMVIPTPDCGEPTLVLGATTFQIENLSPASDGSLTVPSDTYGIAYWVEGTDTNYMFVLSPMPENLAAMSTITVGSPATATWSDCSSTTYNLSAPQQSSLNSSALPDQSQAAITVFFQTDPSGAGFVFTGGMTEQKITTINTPAADEVQAEISLLETTTSRDGTEISISVSIQNYGQSAFDVAENNISLTQPEGTPLALAGAKPRLPEKISSGETKSFEFTFPRPSSPTATLKIFTVEYDIEGY